MTVDNWNVYNMGPALVASGLPMQAEYSADHFKVQAGMAAMDGNEIYDSCVKRMDRLAAAPAGSGHDCALKGILVTANVTGTQAWWMQFERYHFCDIVSSQSKMHRLKAMSIREVCNPKTDSLALTAAEERLFMMSRNQTDFENALYSCPIGLELTAHIVTNYLALKTIYAQRKDHRLQEWHVFCDWIRQLPHSEWITLKEKQKGETDELGSPSEECQAQHS